MKGRARAATLGAMRLLVLAASAALAADSTKPQATRRADSAPLNTVLAGFTRKLPEQPATRP